MRTVLLLSMLVVVGCGQVQSAEVTKASPSDQSPDEAELFGIGKTGLVQPPTVTSRYRRAEYPADKSFYQWWFFNVRDLANKRHFTFTYSMLDAREHPEQTATRIMFSAVDTQAHTRFLKTETFPLSQLSAQNDFDIGVYASKDAVAPAHRISVLADGSYRIQGEMTAPEAQADVDGTLNGVAAPANVLIRWDLTLRRVYGWYGQNRLEGVAEKTGTIAWNPYAHDSVVSGTVQIGDQVYPFHETQDYRGYCDMNWGIEFPHGKPTEDNLHYAWGWYEVTRPPDATHPEQSIVAGMGTQHLNDIEMGAFADVRLGPDPKQDGFQFVGLETLKPAWNERGVRYFDSSDSAGKDFTVTRDQWTGFADGKGAAVIPLHQQVSISTLKYAVTLDYYSTPEQTVRLPFYADGYVFSDFEALGADVHVVVKRHPLFKDSQVETVADFWSNAGGVEFGYLAPYE